MIKSRILIAVVGLLLGCSPRPSLDARSEVAWTAAWAPSQQLTEPRNMPPAPGLRGSTLRQAFRVALGGDQVRFRFSNVFGDAPLTISDVRIAHYLGDGVIDPASDSLLRFHGATSITIAAGTTAHSDALNYRVAKGADLAVTMYVDAVSDLVTGHPGSRTTSYLQSGNNTKAPRLENAVPTDHWYLVAALDVVRPDAGVIAALGNSITDGRGSGTNKQNRWTDNLAARLPDHIGVINAGLGGNCVIRACLGPPAVERLDRDVLDQPGVRWVIVLEGVNDIGGARNDSIAQELIAAHTSIVRRIHARGMRAIGATILPFAGSQYDSPAHEHARQAFNQWIRSSGVYDAVIDFDLALRDPANPSRLLPSADTGDHLHPNEHGYQLMAATIDLRLFR